MRQIAVEEVHLKPIKGSSADVPTGYHVIVDGKRSPLYFSRRDVNEAITRLLESEQSS